MKTQNNENIITEIHDPALINYNIKLSAMQNIQNKT